MRAGQPNNQLSNKILLTGLASLLVSYGLQIKKALEKTTFNFYKLDNLRGESQDLKADLILTAINPSKVTLPVPTGNFNLFWNNQFLGYGQLKKWSFIKPGTNFIEIQVSLDPQAAGAAIVNQILTGSLRGSLDLTGRLEAGPGSIPINWTYQI